MNLRIFVTLSALTLTIPTVAHADTILLGSYGTGMPSLGVSNSSTSYSPAISKVNSLSTNTYNIDPSTTWHAALPNSSYISFDPNTAPDKSYVAPNGDYFYTSTFVLTAAQAAQGLGTMSVLADDTVSIFLNGTMILAPAIPMGPGNTYYHCSDSGPSCNIPTIFSFTGFAAGTNTLTFDVKQVNFANEGLDFSGSVVSVPEPASLALFGTGLLGAIGLLKRRYKTNIS